MFTERETLQKLIQSRTVTIPNVKNERLRLVEFDAAQLEHASIDALSEAVKILRVNEPHADTGNPITLNTGVPVTLDYQKVVWDSVVVADSLALTTVYVENDDYVIDYDNGTIERASVGSAIADGGTVYVWYLYYTTLVRGNDYNIDNDYGTINRRAGTTIPDGATVWVDYSHSEATVTDDAIDEAVRQSEHFITSRLKSGYDNLSDDEGLKTAATNFAMSILCHAMAFKELNNARVDEADALAGRWMNLAGDYGAMAWGQFSKYLNVNRLDYGGMVQNRYSGTRTRRKESPTVVSGERRY